jgi:hypothetical protein
MRSPQEQAAAPFDFVMWWRCFSAMTSPAVTAGVRCGKSAASSASTRARSHWFSCCRCSSKAEAEQPQLRLNLTLRTMGADFFFCMSLKRSAAMCFAVGSAMWPMASARSMPTGFVFGFGRDIAV